MNCNMPALRPEDEIHLRHLTVDEALYALDKYLDSVFMAGLRQVRVVHGKGSGTLRQTVRETLQVHPLVKSFRSGGDGEGGEGVTVVDMATRSK